LNFATLCNCVLGVISPINIHYVPKLPEPDGLCNGTRLCSFWGKNWSFIYIQFR